MEFATFSRVHHMRIHEEAGDGGDVGWRIFGHTVFDQFLASVHCLEYGACP